MTRVFAENENNDLYLGSDNTFAIKSDLEATLQLARSAVEVQTGEALFNIQKGIPTDKVVWSGTPNLQQFEFHARKQIRSASGVIGVDDFYAEMVGDVLTYQAVIKTIYGQGVLNGSL
tara:strand:- start:2569 stop:2922 length:354 start_codon:yes stop_codon:yes gene_type:complete